MPITNAEYRTIQARAIKALEAEFGAGTIKAGRGTLETNPTISFTFMPQDAKARATLAETQFRNLAHTLGAGMKPTDFGRRFMCKGRVYRITGCNPSKPKFNVSVTRDDGREYGMPDEQVTRLLATADVPG